MTPSPDAIVRFHSDLYTPPIERVGALPILRKCKFNGFGEFPVLPDWLVKTMAYLEMKDDGEEEKGCAVIMISLCA
jgi:hypothetical protein